MWQFKLEQNESKWLTRLTFSCSHLHHIFFRDLFHRIYEHQGLEVPPKNILSGLAFHTTTTNKKPQTNGFAAKSVAACATFQVNNAFMAKSV